MVTRSYFDIQEVQSTKLVGDSSELLQQWSLGEDCLALEVLYSSVGRWRTTLRLEEDCGWCELRFGS